MAFSRARQRYGIYCMHDSRLWLVPVYTKTYVWPLLRAQQIVVSQSVSTPEPMDGLLHAPQWIVVPLPVFTSESVDGHLRAPQWIVVPLPVFTSESVDGLLHAPQWIVVPLPVFTPESVDGLFTCTTTIWYLLHARQQIVTCPCLH